MEFLEACPLLDRLNIEFTKWRLPPETPARAKHSVDVSLRRSLKELTLLSSPILGIDPVPNRSFVPSFPLQYLEKITISLYSELEANFANNLFQLARSSLLCVTLGETSEAPFLPKLNSLTELHKLNVTLNSSTYMYNSRFDLFQSFVDLLMDLPKGTLESARIHFDYGSPLMENTDWNRLKKQVSSDIWGFNRVGTTPHVNICFSCFEGRKRRRPWDTES